MHCSACAATIISKMRGALANNSCPFCSNKIMSDHKAQQFSQLVNVLDRTRLTNRDDIDAQVKEKLIDVLTRHFEFTRIEGVREEDVIVVDAPTVGVPSSDVVETAGAPLRSPRAAAAKRPRRSGAGSIYDQAQADTYGGREDEETVIEDYDRVSEEEAAKWFQDSTPDEIANRVEQLKGILGKGSDISSSGTSIRRLK